MATGQQVSRVIAPPRLAQISGSATGALQAITIYDSIRKIIDDIFEQLGTITEGINTNIERVEAMFHGTFPMQLSQ